MSCLTTATSVVWRRLNVRQFVPSSYMNLSRTNLPFSTITYTHSAVTVSKEMSSSTTIHPSAFVHENAVLGLGVSIGPFCIVGKNVRLGANTTLASNVVIEGQTTIGENCEFAPFSVIGGAPQDKKHDKGNPEHVRGSELLIGNRCVVREYVTVNCGTKMGNSATVVGDNVWLLAGSHVGHDCVLGDNVVVSNGCQLGGHVRIGDGAVLGGMVGVRQRVHIGRLAMVGAGSLVNNHVPPFSLVLGNRAKVRGVNIRGLKRNGIRRRLILDFCSQLRALYKSQDRTITSCLSSSYTNTTAVRTGISQKRRRAAQQHQGQEEEEEDNNPLLDEYLEFVSGDSVRQIDEAADGLGSCPYYLHPDR